MVAFGMTDAALGLRPVAHAFDLDFVPWLKSDVTWWFLLT